MISFYQSIKINAIYEIKILLRGWFFRIFAIGSIVSLAGMNVLFHSSVSPVPRFIHSMDSFLPYMSIAMPHYLLIVVLIFLTTDLYKRDKKFNTSDVVYIRDMSNLSFLLGRISGILMLFFALDFIYILSGAIVNLFFSNLSFIWQVYFIYPLLLSMPALIFAVGLTMFLMHVVRNQAVVIILVIGLLVASVFYGSDFGFLMFDILAAKLAFTYSDFTGLSNFTTLASQRLGWFGLGLVFMLLSVLLVQRLPQSKKAKVFIIISLIGMPLVSGSFFFNYYNYYKEGEQLREKVARQTELFLTNETVHVNSYDLNVKHEGNRLFVEAKLGFENRSNHPIDTVKFLLNPGLQISRVSQAGRDLTFSQNGIVAKILLDEKLIQTKSGSLQITYSGSIDDRIAYPHIIGEDRDQTHYIWMYRMEARYGFTEDNYLLLPPALYWYPKTYTAGHRDILKPFSAFSLTVQTSKDLIAISQGNVINNEPGIFEFENTISLKEISLIIGPYDKKTIQVDSLEISVYSYEQHDYYKEFFKEIGDTLPEVVKSQLQDFENKVGLSYPFDRFTIVEVPIHHHAYQRNGRLNADFLQAEQVWLPENMATLSSSYFKHQQERQKRFGNRSNQTYTDLEKEIMLFRRFVNNTFIGMEGRRFGDENLMSFVPDLNVYPLFLNFCLALGDEENQAFAIALESNLRQDAIFQGPRNRWSIGELTTTEEANLALSDTSLDVIMKAADEDLVNKVLAVKGSYLLKKLKHILGESGFDNFMQNMIAENRFKSISVDSIAGILKSDHNYDMTSELKQWRYDDRLPGYLIRGFELYQIRDGDRLRYQVLFSVYNPTPVSGLIEVEFSYPGEGRRRFMEGITANSEQWLYEIEAEKSLQIGIVLDAEPRAIRVNTLVSQNLPTVYSHVFDDAELKQNTKAIEGQLLFSWMDEVEKDDAISDNSGEDFGYVHPQYHSQLKEWIHEDANKEKDEYEGFAWWYGPSQWKKLKFPSFYGEFVHSAYYARSGSGERKATWVADIPEDAFYQVYVHVPDKSDFRRGRRGGESFGVQKYIIYHSDGEDEIELDFSEAEPGWNYMETYYFKEGQGKVVLTDDSDGRMVVADAVKWELKE
ncbi:MAG: hypothetical protein D8M58_20215 [Calditrichaeota bacterium]|nr:MAG: hypothetical protein DWQ03_14200 [Calditrichota bacterium]MBL1207736.1 hypothetical protein [Calditrichota bacterium]NOG47570.1 hypothetical protein [Calditrichota bacterium]